MQLGQYEEALVEFQQARAWAVEVGDISSQAACANNVGICLEELKRFPEARVEYELCWRLSMQEGSPEGQARAPLTLLNTRHAAVCQPASESVLLTLSSSQVWCNRRVWVCKGLPTRPYDEHGRLTRTRLLSAKIRLEGDTTIFFYRTCCGMQVPLFSPP